MQKICLLVLPKQLAFYWASYSLSFLTQKYMCLSYCARHYCLRKHSETLKWVCIFMCLDVWLISVFFAGIIKHSIRTSSVGQSGLPIHFKWIMGTGGIGYVCGGIFNWSYCYYTWSILVISQSCVPCSIAIWIWRNSDIHITEISVFFKLEKTNSL